MQSITLTGPQIQTFTNRRFSILEPTVDQVDIEDIAHALSANCRFTGHTKMFYSVAEHSWHASFLVREAFALEALLHDASEAYIGDMSRPLKHFTEAGKHYMKVEEEIERIIALKFGLVTPSPPEIKQADNLMLFAEKAQLMGPSQWTTNWAESEAAANVTIMGYSPHFMEYLFLRRFEELDQEDARSRPS